MDISQQKNWERSSDHWVKIQLTPSFNIWLIKENDILTRDEVGLRSTGVKFGRNIIKQWIIIAMALLNLMNSSIWWCEIMKQLIIKLIFMLLSGTKNHKKSSEFKII